MPSRYLDRDNLKSAICYHGLANVSELLSEMIPSPAPADRTTWMRARGPIFRPMARRLKPRLMEREKIFQPRNRRCTNDGLSAKNPLTVHAQELRPT